MAYCINCGTYLSENSKFCPNCGTKISQELTSIHMGKILIRRHKTSCTSTESVIIDGKDTHNILANESECVFNLPIGDHTLILSNSHEDAEFIITIRENETLVFEYESRLLGITRCNGYNKDITTKDYTKKKNDSIERKRSFKFWSLVADILVILVIIKACSSANIADNDIVETMTSSQPTSAVSTKVSSTITEEPKRKPIKKILSNWELTIDNFEYKDFIDVGLLLGYKANDDCTYCVVNVSIKNIGEEADTFLPLIAFEDEASAKLIFGKYEYARAELILTDEDLLCTSLNPLTKASGSIVFEVPKFMKNSTVCPKLVFTQDGETFEIELSK